MSPLPVCPRRSEYQTRFLQPGSRRGGDVVFTLFAGSSGGEPGATVGGGLLRLPTQTDGASLSWVSVAALFGAKEVV